ncbi:MAG: hypothetical protein JRN52_08390 [Nitrososphaerota archaeon]|nr:hypothetical protein [Nitrososphaerota archaeon]
MVISFSFFKGPISRILIATAIVPVPSIIFEKYTYYLYTIGKPIFFTYSGDRLWFDIIWFCIAGVVSALIVGRKTKAAVLPPLIGSLILVIVLYVSPLCTVKECYVSSTDGLAPLRDFLLFASLAVVTAASSMNGWQQSNKRSRTDTLFQFAVPTLMGYALSFFPIMHIFAGVSVPYPGNYFQWLMSAAPAGLAGSMWMLDRSTIAGSASKLFAGISGVILALALAIEIPCEDCSGYLLPVSSILLLACAFAVPALLLEVKRRKTTIPPKRMVSRKAPTIITTTTIVLTILILWSFFLAANYQMSVVNGFSGVSNSSLSPLEVGRTFVYSGGYLAIPRVVSESVGVNVSFGNTTLSQSTYPHDFLAAGVGDQSPNCCKDGLDLAYRADVIEFSNGTEAVLARAWWACDVNMACGGYSWEHLLYLGADKLPLGTLANWVELQMNWTAVGNVHWYYRVHYNNGSKTPWVLYSAFTPPAIQNHYWDAGLFYVGEGNHPADYAFFYQFGVSSAYPIKGNWSVFVQCPNFVLNKTRECIPSARYINGSHSFWKVLYTFGETYQGMAYSYLGNDKVAFYYSGKSPSDGSLIW